ncbi:MAG: hypothetical protein DRN78_04485 [Thermoproteota archaeon]|nr:MAG: hypothetical protein DRN78_04485 [Candidatus Korarchaeota archaeon]
MSEEMRAEVVPAVMPLIALILWMIMSMSEKLFLTSTGWEWLIMKVVTIMMALISLTCGYIGVSEGESIITVASAALGLIIGFMIRDLATTYGAEPWEPILIGIAGLLGAGISFIIDVLPIASSSSKPPSTKATSTKPAKAVVRKEKHDELYVRVLNTVKRFRPSRRYRNEFGYHTELQGYLKAKFPEAKVELQTGSSRPDIVIRNIAIEVKGPTRRRELKTIADKLVRYRQYYDHVIVVLFEVNVNRRYLNEWLRGIKESFPDVDIIVK